MTTRWMHMKPIIVLALAIVHNAASAAAIVLFLSLCHVESDLIELSCGRRKNQAVSTHWISSKLRAIVALGSERWGWPVVRRHIKVLYAAGLKRVRTRPILQPDRIHRCMVRTDIDFSATSWLLTAYARRADRILAKEVVVIDALLATATQVSWV